MAATTFEPDPSVNTISFYIPGATGANYIIGRVDDGWLLQGGNRVDFQNGGPRADTFGELYDLMLEYTSAIAASETALAAEIATILPQPPG